MRKLLILLFLSIPAWGQITDYNVPRSGVGLTVCIGPGSNTLSGSVVTYAGSCQGPFGLNATTFGYLDSVTGNLLTNTTGAPANSCPIFEADTNQFQVTAVRDKRPSICGVATSGGSGTVSANSGSAGAIANYAAAGGSTTVGPDATFLDNGTRAVYSGTTGLQVPSGAAATPSLALGGTVDGFYKFGTHQVGMVSNGFVAANFNGTDGLIVNNATFIGWCATGTGGTCLDGAVTLSVPSTAAIGAKSLLQVGSGSANATTGKVEAAAYMSLGTTFTSSGGCTEGSLTGGATAGRFTTSGSTSCTTTVTMGNTATAPNGWQCSATDITTVGDAANPHMTTSNATTATIATGTIVSGDVISFACTGY